MLSHLLGTPDCHLAVSVAADRGLDNRLAAAGWRVLRFTWSQVVHDPDAVLALVRAALADATADCHLSPLVRLAAA